MRVFYAISRTGRFLKSHVVAAIAVCSLSLLIYGACSQPVWADVTPAVDPNDALLSMLNDVRTKAGLAALTMDQRISDAAAMHLASFITNERIADQFDGEPSLLGRLRMAQVLSGSAGEIMLRAKTIDQVPALLKAADIQKALLNPAYSLAGVAQMQHGPEIFIVADLVRPLRSLSPDEVENLMIDSLQQARRDAKLINFKIVPMRQLRGTACDMAKKDSLKTAPINPYSGYIGTPSNDVRNFTFTAVDPGALPHNIQVAGDDPKINTASLGVCFAKSKTYPDGIYWVALVLYGGGALQK